MTGGYLNRLVATERRRTAIITLLLGVAIALIYVQALVQRAYLTWLDYAIVFSMCMLAGALIIDFARAALSYLVAMALAVALMLSLLTLPSTLGELSPEGSVAITNIWITVVFNSIFPFQILSFLLASFIGAFLGEQYF